MIREHRAHVAATLAFLTKNGYGRALARQRAGELSLDGGREQSLDGEREQLVCGIVYYVKEGKNICGIEVPSV